MKKYFTFLAVIACVLSLSVFAFTQDRNPHFRVTPIWEGTLVWNPVNIGDGEYEMSQKVTTTARAGDAVIVFPPYSLQGIAHSGYVSTTDDVRIILTKSTSTGAGTGAVNLGSGTWRVWVIPAPR